MHDNECSGCGVFMPQGPVAGTSWCWECDEENNYDGSDQFAELLEELYG